MPSTGRKADLPKSIDVCYGGEDDLLLLSESEVAVFDLDELDSSETVIQLEAPQQDANLAVVLPSNIHTAFVADGESSSQYPTKRGGRGSAHV